MSYTNRQLLRRLIGDAGRAVHDVASGDGTTLAFYLASSPIAGDTQEVRVSGTLQTETTHYTADDVAGKITFLSAPASGTDNIIVDYRAVLTVDADLDEALRLYGLAAGDTADIGPAVALLRAALEVCEWKAREYSIAVDISTDGQSISRGTIATAFAARATELRAQIANERTGIQSIRIRRDDGYNASQQVTSDETNASGENPRRKYYGHPDRIP